LKAYDKAKVGAGVLLAYREIAAPLRNRTFSSLAELNATIEASVDLYNEAVAAREERLPQPLSDPQGVVRWAGSRGRRV